MRNGIYVLWTEIPNSLLAIVRVDSLPYNMEAALSLREQIEAVLGEEYHRSLVDSPHGEAEDRVAWPDISVFFFNRNCQNVLEEVKKIWELVPGSRLGRKSL